MIDIIDMMIDEDSADVIMDEVDEAKFWTAFGYDQWEEGR